MSTHNALKGIALTLCACACLALLDTVAKQVSLVMPVFMALWLRYLFQALLTTAWLLHKRGWKNTTAWQWPRTNHPRFQLLRAALLTASGLFAFLSVRFMPLAEFTAVVSAAPLCVTLVAALWLRQPVSRLRWVLVVTGLASVLLILRPLGQGPMEQSGSTNPWALLLPLALLAVVVGYQILSSLMAQEENPLTTQFYTGWLAMAYTALPLPFVWTRIDDLWIWLGTLVMGAASALGHLLLLQAYAHARPATIAPFLYSQIGFAMLGGWLMFGHVPDTLAFLGMALIAVSGAASAWLTVRETR